MNRLAVFLEGEKALTAELSSKGKILNLKTLPRTAVKQLDILGKKNFFVGILPASQVLIKTMEIKNMGQRLLKKTLLRQKEIITALPQEEAFSTARIIAENAQSALFSFQITKKKFLAQFLNEINPDMAVSTPQALFSFARHYFPRSQDLALIHFGLLETTCLHLKAGGLFTSYTINQGLEALSSKEGQEISSLTPDKKLLLEKLSTQLTNTLKAFPGQNRLTLLLTGNTQLLKHLDLFLMNANKETISALLQPEKEEEKRYAIAIGAALEALKPHPVQFLDGP
ncbi:MAG: hypothetical protein WC371_02625, partial [Parachlamydiales bacterium]